VFGYFAVNKNLNNKIKAPAQFSSDTIVNDRFGFSFVPPEGWKLLEGTSAVEGASFDDSFKDYETMDLKSGSEDFEKLQNYIIDWVPNLSRVLSFTSLPDIDVKSRDAEYVALMGIEEKSLILNRLELLFLMIQ
jgi:hypothetical protein